MRLHINALQFLDVHYSEQSKVIIAEQALDLQKYNSYQLLP